MASKNAIAEEIERLPDNFSKTQQEETSNSSGEVEKVGTLYRKHFVAAINRVSPSVGIEVSA